MPPLSAGQTWEPSIDVAIGRLPILATHLDNRRQTERGERVRCHDAELSSCCDRLLRCCEDNEADLLQRECCRNQRVTRLANRCHYTSVSELLARFFSAR